MHRKRAAARASGLCITCCKRQPREDCRVCDICLEGVKQSRRRRKALVRERNKMQQIIDAHERAGDLARDHHLHEDAGQHYQAALSIEVISAADHTRISQKFADVLFLGRDPHLADPLLDRALNSYVNEPSDVARIIEILLQKAQQLWIASQTSTALAVVEQAIQISKSSSDRILHIMTNGMMAHLLHGLARYEEAAHFLQVAGKVRRGDTASVRAMYHLQRAISASAHGRANEGFAFFEKAAQEAKEDMNEHSLVRVWSHYAFWAMALGNVDCAKASYEWALVVARQLQVVWYIPFACLDYAQFLFRIGQYGAAYEYLLNALSYESRIPFVAEMLAEVGIPLALHFKDETTLVKCARPAALDFAFRTGRAGYIGSAAAEFARWHAACGREQEAQDLLHRAVGAVSRVVQIWALPISVARYGSHRDFPKARTLIEERAALSHSGVARASLSLFDALVAQRRGRESECASFARDALKRFELLGWHGYADVARQLIPGSRKSRRSFQRESAFSAMSPNLTTRERQVAELVLKGQTNREIARALSISENTVETHMGSIMNRLGIRSRYQLGEALTSSNL